MAKLRYIVHNQNFAGMTRSALATAKLGVFEAWHSFDFATLCTLTRTWIVLLLTTHSRDTTSCLAQFADANDLF